MYNELVMCILLLAIEMTARKLSLDDLLVLLDAPDEEVDGDDPDEVVMAGSDEEFDAEELEIPEYDYLDGESGIIITVLL